MAAELRSIAAQTHRGDISGSCLFHVTLCDMMAEPGQTVKWHKPTIAGLSAVPSQLDY